jgi:hypothetical protein
MANRQHSSVADKFRAVALDPDFTWEVLQLRLRNTDRKIRKLLAMKMKTHPKRKSRPALQARTPRAKRGRKASTPA